MSPLLDEQSLTELAHRLSSPRLVTNSVDSWEQGVPKKWLSQLLEMWRNFNTQEFQARLESLNHQHVVLGDVDLHFVHEVGSGSRPTPLLLTHGWPSSFWEFVRIIPLLTDPSTHGGSEHDAFSVVVPSLPGFGFSRSTRTHGYTAGETADLWNELMVEVLGFEKYFAHGSDLGAGVTAQLARRHEDRVLAIHLATPGLAPPSVPVSHREKKFSEEVASWGTKEGGYSHEHGTKPMTIGAALLDSPVGLAAWIGEKIWAWSSPDRRGDDGAMQRFLLDTLTLTWSTGTAASSLLPYWVYQAGKGERLSPDDPCQTPTAVSIFAGERVPFPKPPQELGARYFALSSWREFDSGGHFPSVSDPELLAETLRDVFRPYRTHDTQGGDDTAFS